MYNQYLQQLVLRLPSRQSALSFLMKDPEMEVDTLLCKISALVSLLSSLENEVCLCLVKPLVIIDKTDMATFMGGKSVMPLA